MIRLNDIEERAIEVIKEMDCVTKETDAKKILGMTRNALLEKIEKWKRILEG